MIPFFVSIPHSGEEIPAEAYWLKKLPEPILFCDVDRFVDQLYVPSLESLQIPFVLEQWHRYAADLNRLPEDVDEDSVEGSKNPSGTHTTGIHWSKTTKGDVLMKAPISRDLHDSLLKKCYYPFHNKVRENFESFKGKGFNDVYHLDAHSMPSMGTNAHRDPGEARAQIIVSDQDGKSCKDSYKDLVIKAYETAGFEVAYNWPYKGGRVTQTYGKPEKGQHTIQVELNRSLYMNEETKQMKVEESKLVKGQIKKALQLILQGITALLFVGLSCPVKAESYNLKQMIQRVVQESPNVQAAEANYSKSIANSNKALSAFFPEISFSAVQMEQKYPDIYTQGLPPGAVFGFEGNSYSASLEAQQKLFVGGAVYKGWKISQLNTYMEKAKLFGAKNESISVVVQAVVDWLFARDQLKSLLESQKTQKEFVEITRKKARRGAAFKYELHQAEANYLSYAPRVEDLKKLMVDKEEELKAALQLETLPPLKLDWPKDYKKPLPSLKDSLELAQKTRPDKLMSEIQQKMAEQQKGLDLASEWPALLLTGAFNYQNREFGELFDSASRGHTISLSLKVPLFSGLSSFHKRKASEQAIYAAERNKRFTELKVTNDVAQARQAVVSSKLQKDQTQKWAVKARMALQEGLKSYRVGKIRSVQWIQLQTGKEQAELQYIGALKKHQMSLLQWGLSVGLDLEKFYIELVE